MKYLIISLFLLGTLTSEAQIIETGLFTGICQSSYTGGTPVADQSTGYSFVLNRQWDKGLYFRLIEKKNALNINYSIVSGANTLYSEEYTSRYGVPGHAVNRFDVNTNIHQVNFDFQRQFYCVSKFSFFGGLNINLNYVSEKGIITSNDLNSFGNITDTLQYRISAGDLKVRFGFSESLRYDLTKNLCISINLDEALNPFISIDESKFTYPNLGLYGNIAIGYKF